MCCEKEPDLILLDLHMPVLNGFEVLEQLGPLIRGNGHLPVLVLTADVTPQVKRQALAAGAKDFLTKPLDRIEVQLRVTNLLEMRLHNAVLEASVVERTAKLQDAQLETLQRLATAAEYRDDDTGQHTKRVGALAAAIARNLGLKPPQIEAIERAAPLHDVGKIGISDLILLKPAKLTDEEFEIIKTHTTIGAKILSASSSPLLQLAEVIALAHHERWEGNGYPAQLAGKDIPIEGRIVTIADVFDALMHDRPYKKAWALPDAIAEIERQSGRQFDPDLVACFREVISELISKHGTPLPTSTISY
jgi:putative two-component system response regulator